MPMALSMLVLRIRLPTKNSKLNLASSGLSEDEIEKMVKEAESHAEDDRKRKEQVEVGTRLIATTAPRRAFLKMAKRFLNKIRYR